MLSKSPKQWYWLWRCKAVSSDEITAPEGSLSLLIAQLSKTLSTFCNLFVTRLREIRGNACKKRGDLKLIESKPRFYNDDEVIRSDRQPSD
ncbi:MAG: hypothetical protein SFY66_23095 [Oculatellaceae cyanobacterium bins.114]|nr:hypothetical protein [Oculatellaceae cyanobacterium bins.114]